MRSFLILLAFLTSGQLYAQTPPRVISATVTDSLNQPLAAATATVVSAADSSELASVLTSKDGLFRIELPRNVSAIIRITHSGFQTAILPITEQQRVVNLGIIKLTPVSSTLAAVTVSARKPPVEFGKGKTVVNVDGMLSNSGATALEVLEKSPGVSTDKDGNLSLYGKPNVTVMMDGKPTYLSPADLSSMLSSMSSSQIESIELSGNPGAAFDAAGSSGIINIKLKKNRSKGFNGSASISAGQGVYPKNNQSLNLNYRTGKINLFLNYSLNIQKGFGELYALRKYYQPDEKTITGMLEQPAFFRIGSRSHAIKTGIDYTVSKNTNVGITFTGQQNKRRSVNWSTARWMDPAGTIDSLIQTNSDNRSTFRNGGINLNIQHRFAHKSLLTIDGDLIDYKLGNHQAFTNEFTATNGYIESIRGDLPSTLKIASAKIDYSRPLLQTGKFEAGIKHSAIATDNYASYFINDGGTWKPDYNKTNHFLYNEHINAAYANSSYEIRKWALQAGLRFEQTRYDATQRDNPTRQDSSFRNDYASLFPSANITYKLDSIHSFTVTAGRRIDRPPFQKLNPFIFIINKYTYQQGNPYILPQYSWNFEVSHSYKNLLSTTISYSETKNYFSQVFHSDPSTGLIIYTEGNLGRMRNLGLSVSSGFDITGWWTTNLQGSINDRKIEGFVWDERRVSLATFYFNANNQFRFGNGWSGELSGFFHTSEQELQEITDPTGQLTVAIGKQLLKKKGMLKLTARDIFYTQAMKGNTLFKQASEYFKFTRDTRVITIAFTYRFGKTFEMRKTGGSSSEEMNRAGSGN